jgi:hypothetical protein
LRKAETALEHERPRGIDEERGEGARQPLSERQRTLSPTRQKRGKFIHAVLGFCAWIEALRKISRVDDLRAWYERGSKVKGAFERPL